MRITVIGRPASGKSTLTTRLLARDPSLRSFGVRRHFAAEVERGTSTGLRVRDLVAGNQWIPDPIVVGAVDEVLGSGRLGRAFVFEGMPGNRAQAALFDAVLDNHTLPLDGVVWVDTPESVCRARAARRLVCYACDGGSHEARRVEGTMTCATCAGEVTPRAADADEPLSRRLELYQGQCAELLDYYGPRVHRVDGTQSADIVLADVWQHLGQRAAA
ncbi:MAG TPA: nucleoside monophosphate kinase [Trebonia sp.]|jgi:adenylate kinase family enzyme|nr:nucleoside monophosphate kinase [Trebonia sp.]